MKTSNEYLRQLYWNQPRYSSRSSHLGPVLMNPTSTHEDLGSIPDLTQWVKDLALPRCHLDPMLLWLWCRLVTTAPIWPLAWEFPYCRGCGPKKTKKKKKDILQNVNSFNRYCLALKSNELSSHEKTGRSLFFCLNLIFFFHILHFLIEVLFYSLMLILAKWLSFIYIYIYIHTHRDFKNNILLHYGLS